LDRIICHQTAAVSACDSGRDEYRDGQTGRRQRYAAAAAMRPLGWLL